MLKFLLKNDPLYIFVAPLLVLLALGFNLTSDSDPAIFPERQNLLNWFEFPLWLNLVLSALLAAVTAFLFNQFIQVLGVLRRISNMPLLMMSTLFWAVTASAHRWDLWLLTLLSTILFFWIMRIIEEPEKLKAHMFNTGVLIGFCSLIDVWSIGYLVIAAVALSLSAQISVRRVAVLLVGFLIPFYFIDSVLFIADQPLIWPDFEPSLMVFEMTYTKNEILAFGIVGLMVVLSFFTLSLIEQSSTLKERKKWRLILALTMWGCVVMLSQGYFHAIYYVLLPTAALFSKLFLNVRNPMWGNLLIVFVIMLLFLVHS